MSPVSFGTTSPLRLYEVPINAPRLEGHNRQLEQSMLELSGQGPRGSNL